MGLSRNLVKRSNLRKVFLGRKRDADLDELTGSHGNAVDVERMLSAAVDGSRYHKRPRPFLGKRTPCQAPSWISDLDGADTRFLSEEKRPLSKPFLGKRSVTGSGSGCDEQLIDFAPEMFR